jgi:subtilisin family serine protease
VDVALTQTTSTGIKRIGAFANKALLINEANDYTINADVAVIDAGVSAKETDINILKRVYCTGNLISATCTEGVGNDEASGHGTLVTSTLGAVDNKEGVVGVAPGVRIWSAKVLDPKALESEVVAALNWVIENAKSIEVVNMSLGCETLPCTRTSASEAMTKAIEAGVVVVVAAGNETSDASKSDYAKNPTAITVSGAADYDGAAGGTATSWWYPSCGLIKQPTDTKKGEDDQSYTDSNFGTVIDLAAPAVCIRGAMPEDRGGGLGWGTGTSFAAPQVSGAAAILAAQSNPENKANVEAIRNSIVVAGTLSFKDNSGDSVQEKMLELSDEKTFK